LAIASTPPEAIVESQGTHHLVLLLIETGIHHSSDNTYMYQISYMDFGAVKKVG
jgi:hypothetical protein